MHGLKNCIGSVKATLSEVKVLEASATVRREVRENTRRFPRSTLRPLRFIYIDRREK